MKVGTQVKLSEIGKLRYTPKEGVRGEVIDQISRDLVEVLWDTPEGPVQDIHTIDDLETS